MDKKLIIGAVVGGLIVFIYQFLSWALINIHKSEQMYTSNQDAIIEYLGTQLTEEGSYFLPTAPPDASSEEQQKIMETSMGKPWAQISYHKSMEMSMGMNMFRGFVADIIAVFLLLWLLLKIPELSMANCIQAAVAVGLVGYLTVSYSDSIWFESNSIPHLIDAILAWALCGAWLGYWINK